MCGSAKADIRAADAGLEEVHAGVGSSEQGMRDSAKADIRVADAGFVRMPWRPERRSSEARFAEDDTIRRSTKARRQRSDIALAHIHSE